jgi:hypothetical protein
MLLLNVLKILGLALSAVSAVIAALKDTRTEDKRHLTPAGKVLLALGLAGFGIALGAQLKEWEESQNAERVSRERTAQMLLEIRRAVTRIDTISMDINYAWPMTDPDFKIYRQRVTRLVRRVNEDRPNLEAGKSAFGLEVNSRSLDHISIFTVPPGSPALPGKNDLAAGWYYASTPRPHIALFKTFFQADRFDAIDEERPNSHFADLVMIPRAGKETLLFLPDVDGNLSSGSYELKGMKVPHETWAPSGSIRSIEDLSEATAVVYLPFAGDVVGRLWAENPPHIVLYFNDQRFPIEPSDFVVQKGHGGIPIFVYKFPKQSSF